MLMGGGEGGKVIIDIRGGGRRGKQKRESPDFRFPEVGISGLCTTRIVQTLSLI